VERLGQVVVGALGEAPHAVGVRAAPAEHDHGQIGVVATGRAVGGADLAQHVEAGRVGQHQVEQKEVGLLVVTEAQGVGRARRRQGPVAIRGQVVAEQIERRRVVLANDDRRARFDLGQHRSR
jgi:hypothetical protein